MSRIIKYCIIVFAIGNIRLTGQTITLPVELVYFNYNMVDSEVLLSWGTATEVNNYGFNVDRYSDSTWQIIGFVFGS